MLLVTCFYGLSQSKTSNNYSRPATSNSVSQKKKFGGATTNAALDTLRHNVCIDKQFSIVFYIVLDSTSIGSPNYPGVGLANPTNLTLLVFELNETFKPICISFKNCSTVIIPNSSYGKSWLKNKTEAYVTATHYSEKTINFYLVDSVHAGYGNTELEGYSYEPTAANLSLPKKDVLVLDKYKLLQGNFAITKHLLGHYFGLPHTFDEVSTPPMPPAVPPPPTFIMSQEFADGSNCYTHGDRFCDTDADSGDPLFPQDGMGNFYILPKDNLMSYYSQRCRFSQEQYNWMAYTIMTKRMYLH